MSDDREKIKALLLSEEIAQIKALQNLLADKQALSQKVSEVLDSATDKTIAANPNFQKKFSSIEADSYLKVIKTNKQAFIDALLPIIGPMIRKSVSSAIRRFVSDVNRAVEMGVSPKALKWRWKSFRTGVPFTEIVFNNTIEYQVQQVFLIDNHTGLLIAHAGHEEALLKDKDAISAMLTAIQDFVKDSVSAKGEGLSAAEIDDDLLWIISGNKAKLAAIIKGAPTQRLRNTMLSLSEEIHLDYHKELNDQSIWGHSPELDTELEKLLLTKSQSDTESEQSAINFWPWLLLLGGVFIWWGWSTFQHQQLKTQLINQLHNTPGFVLTDLNHIDGVFVARGLQDPLATMLPKHEQLIINSTPFLSLDDRIVEQRVKKLLNNEAITINVQDSMLTLSGSVEDQNTLNKQLQLLASQPGIEGIINNTSLEQQLSLSSYLKNNPPPATVQVKQVDQRILLNGFSTADVLGRLIENLNPFGEVDSTAVEVIDTNELITLIKTNPAIFNNPEQLSENALFTLEKIITAFQRLNQLQNNATIKITAKSDCHGSIEKSNQFNSMRLNLVQNYLLEKGIKASHINAKIIECDKAKAEMNISKIGVWFEVME